MRGLNVPEVFTGGARDKMWPDIILQRSSIVEAHCLRCGHSREADIRSTEPVAGLLCASQHYQALGGGAGPER